MMGTLLHMDSSPRINRSHSRELGRHFMAAWKELHPGERFLYRDLAKQTPAPITEEWIAAAYGFDARYRDLLNESDALIAEVMSADRVVITAAMHNFDVPAGLKMWFDNIVRPTRTFSFDDKGLHGLASGKKVLCITARGGIYAPGSDRAPNDHQEPLIRTVLGLIGITDIMFVNAEGINFGDEAREQALNAARERLAQLAATW